MVAEDVRNMLQEFQKKSSKHDKSCLAQVGDLAYHIIPKEFKVKGHLPK